MNSRLRTLLVLYLILLILGTWAGNCGLSSEVAIASTESEVVGLVSGESAYDYDLQLEKMTLDHTISHYSFRSAGSTGATASAEWLVEAFNRTGLESYTETFEFTTWGLISPPSLVLDIDNDPATAGDQIKLASFTPKHLGWPTGRDGIFGQIVLLPLPEHGEDFPQGFWDEIGIKSKIVLVGREFGSVRSWRENYVAKIASEPPLAIVQTWWFSNNSWIPTYSGSQEGRLYAPRGLELRYWDLKIPVGMVNYDDGLRIRKLAERPPVSARVVVDAVIGQGSHYNVIGKLDGLDPSKIIIISSHYDTVVTAGFGDNGAGTAGLLELARVFAAAKTRGIYTPPYTLMFVAFAAEELWLIGSSYFVKQHESELGKVLGVINMDPIGSERLMVSESPSTLDETVGLAARELATPIMTVPQNEASSDNWSFELPDQRDGAIRWAWGLELGLSDIAPTPAVWLGSEPLLWNEISSGKAGWIHTPYDNSTSTEAYGWMKPENLETHLRVAAVSVLRLAPSMSQETRSSTLTTETATPNPVVSYAMYALVPVVLAVAAVLFIIKTKRPARS